MNLKIEHILTTKRGKRCIVIEQYKYTESNILQNETIRFRCTNKKFKVSVLIDNNVKNILEMTTHLHNHEPSTKRSLAVDIIRSSKKKATEQTHEKLNKIIRKELLVDKSGLQDEFNYSDINLIRRSIYRSRKQQYPILPKSQKESFYQLYDMQSTIKYNDQQFCFVNQQKSIVIITCRDNLQ
ncbi:DNA topoisomerase, partial [Aphis craccivora]